MLPRDMKSIQPSFVTKIWANDRMVPHFHFGLAALSRETMDPSLTATATLNGNLIESLFY